MWTLEYAQNYNGRFRGWIYGGTFATRADAEKFAADRGLAFEGDDFIICLERPDDFD